MELITKLVAHRGDHETDTENTLSAFSKAALAGAVFAECDIQFSSDKKPVVIHDADLSRLCQRQAHVSKLDYADLEQACSPHFKLLSLTELLAWLTTQPELTMFIEIKEDARKQLSDDEIAGLIGREMPASLWPQIVIISYSQSILEACYARFGGNMGSNMGWVTDKVEDLQPDFATQLKYVFTDVANAGAIKVWQHLGLKVGVYTVNDPVQIQRLIELGVDLIETNHFTSVIRQLAAVDGH